MLLKWKRRIIPRWRNSSDSEMMNWIKKSNEDKTIQDLDSYTAKKVDVLLKEWRSHKSIGVAADILNFSHISSVLPLLNEPAEYLLSINSSISPILKNFCLRLLNKEENINKVQLDDFSIRKEIFYQQASKLKKYLGTNPRDVIALIDLARFYTALGQSDKAKRAILTAVNLYPNHVFVLRCAARFFIQNNESELALRQIDRSNRTLHNPWLFATKLAIEELLGKQHKHLGLARSLVESEKQDSFDLSELTGAIASIYLINGDKKQARKMFTKALTNPNDNVIAQAMWASNNYDISINFQDRWIHDPRSSEAIYYQCDNEVNFIGAKRAALQWFFDEPFSSRPLKAASFVSGILGEYELTEKYANYGLLLDKNDIELKNNLVCALAGQNKIEEATNYFLQVIKQEKSELKMLSGHTFANLGMILYRMNYFKEAEESYRKAIVIFGKKGLSESQGIAFAFMAHEALLINAPNAYKLLTEAKEMISKLKSKAGNKTLQLIEKKNALTNRLDFGKELLELDNYQNESNIIIANKLIPLLDDHSKAI